MEENVLDNEGSIKTACKALAVLWDPCQPGIHQSNGVIENINLQIVYDIKVTLCAAGLPACVWPLALAYVCMLHNLTCGANGQTPWTIKFGEDFQGETIPLGCGVFSCLHLQSTGTRRQHPACLIESSWGTAWHPVQDGTNSTLWPTLMILLDILCMSILLAMSSE